MNTALSFFWWHKTPLWVWYMLTLGVMITSWFMNKRALNESASYYGYITLTVYLYVLTWDANFFEVNCLSRCNSKANYIWGKLSILASFLSENRRSETERSLLLYKNFCTQRYSWSCNVCSFCSQIFSLRWDHKRVKWNVFLKCYGICWYFVIIKIKGLQGLFLPWLSRKKWICMLNCVYSHAPSRTTSWT